MKSTGILFQPDMIRALLRTQNPKTQTRRIMDPQPVNHPIFCTPETTIRCEKPAWHDADGINPGRIIPCRFGAPGDELWATENWNVTTKSILAPGEKIGKSIKQCIKDNNGFAVAAHEGVVYAADGVNFHPEYGKAIWRPSIFMPRWASRITLVIDNIRAERVSAISEEDAIAEGIEHDNPHSPRKDPYSRQRYKNYLTGGPIGLAGPIGSYRSLWNRINAKPQPVYAKRPEGGEKVISYYIAYPWAVEDMKQVPGVTDIQNGTKDWDYVADYRRYALVIKPDPYVWAITFHRKQ